MARLGSGGGAGERERGAKMTGKVNRYGGWVIRIWRRVHLRIKNGSATGNRTRETTTQKLKRALGKKKKKKRKTDLNLPWKRLKSNERKMKKEGGTTWQRRNSGDGRVKTQKKLDRPMKGANFFRATREDKKSGKEEKKSKVPTKPQRLIKRQ